MCGIVNPVILWFMYPGNFYLFYSIKGCQYGDNCLSAHSEEELEEWKQRGVLQSDKVKRLWETQSSTLAGEVNTKLLNASRPESIVCRPT